MKRRATGNNIQKVEPKPKKGKFRDEDNDAYKTEENVYILTWHNVKPGNEYNNVFYKKEVTISSAGSVGTINISNYDHEKFSNFVKENIMGSDYYFYRGIEINQDGIKVRGQEMDSVEMGLENNYYDVMIPFQTNAYNYDEDTARSNRYGKYYKFSDDYTVMKREFMLGQDAENERMQLYKLTEAGRAATNQNRNFDSGPVPYWEKVPMLKKELTFYRYTNSHISNDAEWIDKVQQEMGTYRFCVDRLPVDTPYETDDWGNVKSESVQRDPYNPNMSESSQWKYNTLTDEREFTVTFTMEIMQRKHIKHGQPDELHNNNIKLIDVIEYDSKYIKSQLQLFDSHFWRGAHVVPPINDNDWFYQIQIGSGIRVEVEFCLQLRGVSLNDIVREPEYEEVRWYLRMYLREIDIKRLLRIYDPTIIPVIHDNQLLRQRRLYDNLLGLKF